jgi:hypothetical protein
MDLGLLASSALQMTRSYVSWRQQPACDRAGRPAPGATLLTEAAAVRRLCSRLLLLTPKQKRSPPAKRQLLRCRQVQKVGCKLSEGLTLPGCSGGFPGVDGFENPTKNCSSGTHRPQSVAPHLPRCRMAAYSWRRGGPHCWSAAPAGPLMRTLAFCCRYRPGWGEP